MTVPSSDVKTADAPATLTAAAARDAARALRPKILAQAPDTERRGFHSEEIHLDFAEAGFYHLLRPATFGGYELDIWTFCEVVMELARADMGTAWTLALASGHNLMAAAWFPEDVQRAVFVDGHFAAPMTSAPSGTITKVSEGWKIDAVMPFSSGIPYSTHVMGHAFVQDDAPGPGRLSTFMVPREEVVVRDDWGHTLGLRGSGSHTVEVNGVVVPPSWVLEGQTQMDIDTSNGTPGLRLHKNPMFGARSLGIFGLELASLGVGGVQGALDEYRNFLDNKRTAFPPITTRAESPIYQRWYGEAVTSLQQARASVQAAAEMFTAATVRFAEGGAPFTAEEDMEILRLAVAGQMTAWRVMELIMRTSGSAAAVSGQRMERIWRDQTMLLSHQQTVVQDYVATAMGAALLAPSS
ncbi:acyl-CoA dehydrogenase family protein [Gordonia terrae]|uniref:acyl-CoA dehydrogenase family protein n=1 Tax=Gordonia hongkongensis TaxID=1701090 RepID=UPI0022B34349|nr:acyl-CoA dehydrogenase family protein [Gordonia terrae]